jgi:hypothetical protein
MYFYFLVCTFTNAEPLCTTWTLHGRQGRPLPMGQPGQSEQLAPPPPNKNLLHTWTTMRQQCYGGKAEMWSVRAIHTFSCTEISGAMLQCYVLTCGRAETTFLAPPRSRRPGKGPCLPHPKAGPDGRPTHRLHHLSFPYSPLNHLTVTWHTWFLNCILKAWLYESMLCNLLPVWKVGIAIKVYAFSSQAMDEVFCIYAFSTLALDRGEWSGTGPSCFTPKVGATESNWMRN